MSSRGRHLRTPSRSQSRCPRLPRARAARRGHSGYLKSHLTTRYHPGSGTNRVSGHRSASPLAAHWLACAATPFLKRHVPMSTNESLLRGRAKARPRQRKKGHRALLLTRLSTANMKDYVCRRVYSGSQRSRWCTHNDQCATSRTQVSLLALRMRSTYSRGIYI